MALLPRKRKKHLEKLLDKYNQNYDYIVVDSDDTGILAEYCAGTVIIQDVKKYSIDDTNALVKSLNRMAVMCLVL